MPDNDALNTETQVESAEPPKPEFASKGDYDKLLGEVSGLKEALGKAGERLALLDTVADAITGKKESDLTTEDALVVKELRRLMPHILPNAGALDSLPKMTAAVDASAKAAAQALTEAAFGYQLELQEAAGLPIEDSKLNFHVGVAVKEWINQSPARVSRFWRGDRLVLKEGFEEVKDLFVGTKRTVEKQQVASAIVARPKNAAPVGKGAPNSDTGPTVDFTNPKSVRTALKAALAT